MPRNLFRLRLLELFTKTLNLTYCRVSSLAVPKFSLEVVADSILCCRNYLGNRDIGLC